MFKKLGALIIQYGLIPWGHVVLKVYLSLVKIEPVNEEGLRIFLQDGNRVIAGIWHQRILGVLNYAGRFGGYRPSVMISRSRDGELISRLIERLNFRPVRGSSSSHGREALAAMVKDLKEHPFAVHALDGPTGPRGVVKAGLIRMAQLSGAAIVPVYISCSRFWQLRSWDRFIIPKPFSTVRVRFADPIFIPADLGDERFESVRQRVEEVIRETQEAEDRRWGWSNLLCG